MRKGWTLGVVAGLAVAGAAFGAEAQAGSQQQMKQQEQMMKQQEQMMKQQPTAQSQKWQATKHLAVIDVALNSAEENADMMQKLAQEPQAYDQDHGQVFLTNIQTSLAQAKTHFGHLQPLARTDAEKQNVNRLGERISAAEKAVGPLAQNLSDAKQVQQNATKLQAALDNSQEPIEKIAKQMKVDIDVG